MTTARKMSAVIFLCGCLARLSFAGEQDASNDQLRSISVPQHGTLILDVPSTWTQKVRQPPGDLPPTITFAPNQGDDFVVLITPLWSPKNDPTFNKPENLKKAIDGDLREMLPGALEKKVDVQEFVSVDGTGYYFFVTDKAPRPGEYPHAVRAAVGVGDLLLSVTILCRSKDSEGITSMIKALQEAKQIHK